MRQGLLILTLLNTTALQAQEKIAVTNDVQSILDDLDRRFEEQDNQMLTIEEQQAFDDSPSNKLRFRGKTITASSNIEEELKRLSDAVLDLEKDVQDLDSRVQLTKQKVIEAAKIDNIVNIEGVIKAENSSALRSLIVKLDGYVIYRLDESQGVWLPTKKLPLYNGPLPPGDHQLQIEGHMMKSQSEGIPLNAGNSVAIRESKLIKIAEGTANQEIKIDIEPKRP